MKRLISLNFLIAMMIVFIFVPISFGQEECSNIGSGPFCGGCTKCPLGSVPCPGTATEIVGQGQQVTVTTDLEPFDYDGEGWLGSDKGFGKWGYCPNQNYDATSDPARFIDCKFLFDVCDCPEACAIKAGEKIGIQMIIDVDGNPLTDDGVYFADPNINTIRFGIYHTKLEGDNIARRQKPCIKTDGTDTGPPADLIMSLGNIYRDADGNVIDGKIPDLIDAEKSEYGITREIKEVKYYTGIKREKSPKDETKCEMVPTPKFTTDVAHPKPLNAGKWNTVIPSSNQVFVLESKMDGDYIFNTADVENENCVFWIDIPPMRIDPTKVDAIKSNGGEIKVIVKLLFNRSSDTICPYCDPPDYCECSQVVAKVCCDDIPTTGKGCLFFPYVVQNVQDANGWAAGVAITARETLPANAYVKLTLIDGAGNTATYTNNAVTRIWAFMMEDVMPKFTGAAIIPGAASLQVETNYNVHGYSFMTDGKFGAGTLATGCTAGQCCP